MPLGLFLNKAVLLLKLLQRSLFLPGSMISCKRFATTEMQWPQIRICTLNWLPAVIRGFWTGPCHHIRGNEDYSDCFKPYYTKLMPENIYPAWLLGGPVQCCFLGLSFSLSPSSLSLCENVLCLCACASASACARPCFCPCMYHRLLPSSIVNFVSYQIFKWLLTNFRMTPNGVG